MRTQIRLDPLRTLVIEPAKEAQRVLFTIKLGGVAVGSFKADESRCARLTAALEAAFSDLDYVASIQLDDTKELRIKASQVNGVRVVRVALALAGVVVGDFSLDIDRAGACCFGVDTAGHEAGMSLIEL